MKILKFFPLFLLFWTLSVNAQQLDPTFGTNGLSLVAFPYNPPPYSGATSVGMRGFVRSDGGISIFGRQDFGIIKMPPFSRDRVVTYSAAGNGAELGDPISRLEARDAALQPDGKMVAAGPTDVDPLYQPNSGFVKGNWFVERFNQDRTLDTSFGINGTAIIDFGTDYDVAKNIAVTGNGKILVSGSVGIQTGAVTIIARLNPDGTADPTFGPSGNGYVILFDAGILSQKMVLKQDGRIMLLGMRFDELNDTVTTLFQLTPDGAPDTAFGVDGLAYTVDYRQLTLADVKARPNGESFILSTRKYVPDGTRNYREQDVVMTALNSDGSINGSFGQGGRVVENLSPPTEIHFDQYSAHGEESANALLIENSGNIIIAMTARAIGPARSAGHTCCDQYAGQLSQKDILFLMRYNASGKLIARSYTRQTPRTEYIHSYWKMNGMFEQPDSKLVVYGSLQPSSFDPGSLPPGTNSPTHILMARFSSISAVNSANNFYDYNLNGQADFATYAEVAGQYGKWKIVRKGYYEYQELTLDFGLEGDTPVPADYDGDGLPDLGVFRGSTGDWFTRKYYLDGCEPMDCTGQVHFGSPGDVPAPGDFDGDGKTDRAVFRPSEGNWYILFSSGGWTGLHFGQNGDLPVTGDYDDDGRSDVAVIRRENGLTTWFILQSSNNQFIGIQFGLDSDKTATADFNGDGRTDIAVFRPSEGNWYILSNYTDVSYYHWGQAGDIPEPADYDGDGKDDVAVFRPSQRAHYALPSHGTNPIGVNVGGPADLPVAGAYVR
jgi:uncharacterized delta-60 repeat protein